MGGPCRSLTLGRSQYSALLASFQTAGGKSVPSVFFVDTTTSVQEMPVDFLPFRTEH
jgi:hypothetical protein